MGTVPQKKCAGNIQIFQGYCQISSDQQGRDFPQWSKAEATVLETGERIEILYPIQPRGQISQFSPRSRVRFLKFLHSLRSSPTHFITLTYPSEFSPDSREWKRDLDALAKRISRRFPRAWLAWKLEPQKRGAPHYHLIGDMGQSFQNEKQKEVYVLFLREWFACAWFEIVGSGDEKHLRAGTQVDIVAGNERTRLRKYVSKYVGKTVEENQSQIPGWALPGRFWGVIGRKNLPEVEVLFTDLTVSEQYVLRRIMRKWVKKISPRYSKFLGRIRDYCMFMDKEKVIDLICFVCGSRDQNFNIYRSKEKVCQYRFNFSGGFQ